MTPEIKQALINLCVFGLPLIAVAIFVVPEILKCWKMHMHYKARKQQMDIEHEIILKVLKAVQRRPDGD